MLQNSIHSFDDQFVEDSKEMAKSLAIRVFLKSADLTKGLLK